MSDIEYTYRIDSWSEKFNCYMVREFKGDGATCCYMYKGYPKGNQITLYPFNSMGTREQRNKKTISIFDCKSRR